jgi:hypothetical protein
MVTYLFLYHCSALYHNFDLCRCQIFWPQGDTNRRLLVVLEADRSQYRMGSGLDFLNHSGMDFHPVGELQGARTYSYLLHVSLVNKMCEGEQVGRYILPFRQLPLSQNLQTTISRDFARSVCCVPDAMGGWTRAKW